VRRFLALFGREWRDARWNLVASFAVAAALPWIVHGLVMENAHDDAMALFGGRGLVPLLFALFAAATASDLVSRDVATRRIDALAALPVPGARVWTAKAAFLGIASVLFLAWLVATEILAVNVLVPSADTLLRHRLVEAVPSLLGGLAFGAAALFFSTLMERGMTAAIAALVALTAIAWSVQWAEIPAADGDFTQFVALAVPLAVAIAFVAASRAAFVRGPIHGPSKLRVAMTGVVALAALLAPAGACFALGLDAASRLPAGAGDPLLRAAYVSPDEKWVAVQDQAKDGASRTWLVGLADDSCREIAPGATWFEGGAWLGGSMLCVRTSSFSVLDGPRHVRQLEVEPTRLGVADERWLRREPASVNDWAGRWAWVREERSLGDGRHVFNAGWYGGSRRFVCRAVVAAVHAPVFFVVTDEGALTRFDTRKEATTELVHDGVTSAELSSDGALLFVETTKGTRILKAPDGTTLAEGLGRNARPLGGRRLLLWSTDGERRVTSVAARDLDAMKTVELGAPRLADRVPLVTWMKDGRFVVCDGDVTLRDASGRTIRRLFPPETAARED
jgi:hypothetical protein